MNTSLLWSIFILALVHVLVSFVMVVLPAGGEKTKGTKANFHAQGTPVHEPWYQAE